MMERTKAAPTLHLLRTDPSIETFEALARWRTFLLQAKQLRESTVKAYTMYLFGLQAALLPRSLLTATEADLLAYLESISNRSASRGAAIRAFRSFFGWAFESGEIETSPAARIRVKRPRRGPAPYMSKDELTRLVVAAGWREERRGWAILLLANTGIRLGSACGIRPEDVRGDVLYVRKAKGDKPYSVPLNSAAKAAVEGLLEAPRPPTATGPHLGTLLGVSEGRLWEWVHVAGKDAGFRAYPHALRHYFASHLSEAGVPPVTIAELMNHGDLGLLVRMYVGVNDPQKIDAVRRLE